MYQTAMKRPLKRVTAIDLGTNSFHAVIVDIYPDGSFYTIDKFKEMVLLAEVGFNNRLSEKAISRALDALKKIKTLSDHQGAEEILAYATSAIREAENGGELIQRVIDEIGIKIKAIPGRVEAELIGLSIQHGVKLPKTPSLVMDIGGGSVEFIITDKKKFYFLTSKKLGVARMTSEFVRNDPISPDEIAALEKHYLSQLTDVAQSFALHRGSLLIGSSGTMENIAVMISHMESKKPTISLNELSFSASNFFHFYEKVIGLSRKERELLDGIDEKRVSLLPAGLVLVNTVIRSFGIREVKISSQALREGMILKFIQREIEDLKEVDFYGDPRRKSVLELVHKCDWHEQHSRHVASLALQLFDEFKRELNLTDGDRELLEYAAFMHDIGYYISHSKHHKHALYIIRNADLRGFMEEEIEVISNVARYHRRSTPKSRHYHFEKLSPELKDKVIKLSAILRIADGLDRSHYQNVLSMKIKREKGVITLLLSVESDAQLEIWGASRKNLLFEELTGCKLSIVEAEQISRF